MGQKVNPHGLRVGIIKDWDSKWFANDSAFGDTLVEDYNIRKFLKKKLFEAGVSKFEIERKCTRHFGKHLRGEAGHHHRPRRRGN